MEFEISDIKGRETVLDFDRRNANWRLFLDTRRVAKQHGRPAQLTDASADFFYRCVEGFLGDNGLEVENYRGRPRISVDDNGKISVVCMPTEVISGSNGKVNGYKPHLTFRTDRSNLTVTAFLRRQGRKDLEVIDDYLARRCLEPSEADGFKRARVERTSSGLYVASLEKVPKVLAAMKRIYRNIGEERFEEVAGLLAGSRAKMQAKSREYLTQQYKERRRDLLPARLRI